MVAYAALNGFVAFLRYASWVAAAAAEPATSKQNLKLNGNDDDDDDDEAGLRSVPSVGMIYPHAGGGNARRGLVSGGSSGRAMLLADKGEPSRKEDTDET